MNVESFMKILQKTNAESCYNVAIPSLGKNVKFKSMTVSQKKSIAKAVIDSEAPSDAHGIKIALIKELMLDSNVDIDKFNIVDMIATLSQIAMNNVIDFPEMKFDCSKCSNEVKFKIDYEKITNNCMSFKMNKLEKEYEKDAVKYKFGMTESLMQDVLMFLTIKGLLAKQYNMNDKKDSEKYTEEILPYYAMSCINSMSINGEYVDNMDFKSKIDMLSYIPADFMYNANSGLIKMAVTNFSPTNYDKLFNVVTCPFCQDKKEGLLTIENFFTI